MRILILSVSDLENDPRISRHINFLQKNHDITCVGINPPKNQNVEFIKVIYKFHIISFIKFSLFSIIFKKYELAYEHFFKTIILKSLKLPKEKNFDLIVANDLDTLPFSFTIKRDAPILFDAHEYSPKELEENFFWRVLFQNYRFYLCRKYLPRCDAMMTVSEGIAKEYEKEFGVHPYIITNASDFHDFTPRKVDPNNIKIIYHGAADPSRNIETMIELMRFIDSRYSLYLMLVLDSHYKGYLKKLKKLAKDMPNINFVDPVPMKDIVKITNQYDIGLVLLEPTNFNNKHSLPNKFFEFIQARLAIAIGPSPEMARIVNKYDLGVVSSDFKPETLAKSLNHLTPEKICHFKMRSHQSAYELSSIKNAEILNDIIINGINYESKNIPIV